MLRLLELDAMARDTFETDEEACFGCASHTRFDGETPLTAPSPGFGAERVKDIRQRSQVMVASFDHGPPHRLLRHTPAPTPNVLPESGLRVDAGQWPLAHQGPTKVVHCGSSRAPCQLGKGACIANGANLKNQALMRLEISAAASPD